PSPRSLMRMSCKRSRATLAEVFFCPRRNDRKDILFPSEQALEEAGFFVVDELQGLVFAEVAVYDVHIGHGDVGIAQMDGRYALVGCLQDGLRFWNDADQFDPQDVLDVLERQH